MADSLISLCLPTYRRPEYLLAAVRSCLAQDYPRLEILVADDSPDDATERALADVAGPIRYWRHQPSLRQAGNVNSLFERARGERLLLLHDDDLLLPGAVSRLAAAMESHPDAVVSYGKQEVIDEHGAVDGAASAALNERYLRTAGRAGLQPPLWAALVQQTPSDAYLIKTEAARQVRMRATADVGDACDFDFWLRLAQRGEPFCFADAFVSQYRVFAGQITGDTSAPALAYHLVKRLRVPAAAESLRRQRLRAMAPAAVRAWLRCGERQAAWNVYWAEDYGWRRRWSARGCYHLGLLLAPAQTSRRLLLRR